MYKAFKKKVEAEWEEQSKCYGIDRSVRPFLNEFWLSKLDELREVQKEEFLKWIESDEFYDLLPGDNVDDWVLHQMSKKVKEFFKKRV